MPAPAPLILSPSADTLVHPEPRPRQHVYILRVIPARTALLACAFFLFVFSAFLAACGWFVVQKLDHQLNDFQRLVIYFHIMNYIFLGIASLIGIYAAITNKHPKRAQVFSSLLFGHFLFGVVSGAMVLQIIFMGTTSICISLQEIGSWKKLCNRRALIKGVSVVAYVSVWMLELLATYVAVLFTGQLQEEEDDAKSLDSPLY